MAEKNFLAIADACSRKRTRQENYGVKRIGLIYRKTWANKVVS